LSSIEKKLDNFSGQIAGVSSIWTIAVGVVGMGFGIVGIAAFILKFTS